MTAPVNLRDLGGIGLGYGNGSTVAGVLYRSDAPLPGDEDPIDVAPWPPTAVVDLRSSAEADDPHPLANHAVIHRIPLTGRAAVTAPAMRTREPSLSDVYREILAESAAELASIVGIVAGTEGPTLVHCGAGRDRTGIVAAILLLLAGVPTGAVVADYRASGPRMPALIERLTARHRPPRMLDAADPTTLDAPTARVDIVIDHLSAHPGGVVGWAVEHGARPEDIRLWRDRFAPLPITREDPPR